MNPVPYVGVQYVDIPQFESLGLTVGQQIAGRDRRHGEREPGAAGRSVRRVASTPRRNCPAVSAHGEPGPWRGPAHGPSSRGTSEEGRSVTVLEDLAPPPKVEVKPRGVSRRERWQLRLPLLPALIYTIVVTQIPFLVTLWYSFQSYFWNTPAPASFNGLSNYKTVFTNPAFRGSLVRSVVMTVIAVIVAMILGVLLRGAAGPQVPRPRRRPDADDHPVPGHARGGRAGVGGPDARPAVRAAQLPARSRSASHHVAWLIHARARLGRSWS